MSVCERECVSVCVPHSLGVHRWDIRLRLVRSRHNQIYFTDSHEIRGVLGLTEQDPGVRDRI